MESCDLIEQLDHIHETANGAGDSADDAKHAHDVHSAGAPCVLPQVVVPVL